MLDADSGEQGSGLDVLLLVGGLQQTQTPDFTSIGSVVSRVSSELLSVGGLKGVNSGGLYMIRQSALLFFTLEYVGVPLFGGADTRSNPRAWGSTSSCPPGLQRWC